MLCGDQGVRWKMVRNCNIWAGRVPGVVDGGGVATEHRGAAELLKGRVVLPQQRAGSGYEGYSHIEGEEPSE
jgi:hypothetical protein